MRHTAFISNDCQPRRQDFDRRRCPLASHPRQLRWSPGGQHICSGDSV